MVKKILSGLTLLFAVIAYGQFFEGYIALPENSPGMNRLRYLTYNRTNNKLYLYGNNGDLAILDATTLNVIKKLCFLGVGDVPPCWLPQNNKLYFPAIVDTSDCDGFFVLDGETDSITDTVRTGVAGLPDDIVDITYNQINHRIYFDDFDKCRIRVADAITHNIIDTIKTIGQPYLMEWNPTNNRLYVSCVYRPHPESLFYSCLNIFDGATNQMIDSTMIRDRAIPNQCPYGGLLYNPFLNKLYFGARTELIIIDCSNDSVIKRLEGYFPHRFLFNYRNNKIYTSTDSSLQISVIDCVTDSVIKIFPDRRIPSCWTSGHWCLVPMSYDSVNNKIFAFTFSQDSVERLTVIDGETDSIIDEYPFITSGLCYDDYNNRLYCVSPTQMEMVVVDGQTNQILDTIITGDYLGGTTVWNPVSNKLYVTVHNVTVPNEIGSVLVIDGTTHRFIKNIPIGREPYYLTVNTLRNKVYCASYEQGNGKITVIDGDRDTILTVINVGSYPCKMEYNYINDKIFCANYENGVAVIDGAADTVITYVRLPFSPSYNRIIWHPGVNKVYCGSADGRVAVIDGVTNQLLKIVPGPRLLDLQYANNLTNNKIYITYQAMFSGGLGIFDAISDTFVRFLQTCYAEGGVCWNAENDKAYFSYHSSYGPGQWYIGVVDGRTDSLVDSIPFDFSCCYMIWNPVNNIVYAEGSPWGACVIDGETDSLLEIIMRPGYCSDEGLPFAINFQEGRVYYTVSEKSRIAVIKGTPSGISENHQTKGLKSNLRVYPNPAKSQTFIRFSLPVGSKISLKIYDITGKLVKLFSTNPQSPTANHCLVWDGSNEFGKKISTGVYIIRLETEKRVISQKIIWHR